MNTIQLDHLAIGKAYREPLRSIFEHWKLKNRVDILFVVDPGIDYQPVHNFGVGSVIAHLRASKVGCMHFRVHIALRNDEPPTVVASPGDFEPSYRGFRFDMEDGGEPVIHRYDQVWCFGLVPNTTSTNDNVINNASNRPASDAELDVLSKWMDERKGGLFGTGDHHILGASMCHRIPRLGTMRRWTNADGVPPIGSPARIDTLRPPSAAFEPGAPGGPQDLINTPHQGDLAVQPIQWIPWQSLSSAIFYQKRPHPVLCHPTLGPINVMPDHAHEGLCVPTAEIDLDASFNFGSGARPEYPDATAGGTKPAPVIIANGSTLGDPPYHFDKGPQPARPSFPMISIYDGHRAGVGRVATDSTWHHWMGVNIEAIQNADNNNWKKISRYFVNLAMWLTPPGHSTFCIYAMALASHFDYPGFQEYPAATTALETGHEFRKYLVFHFGPCWVTEVIRDWVWEVRPKPWDIIQELKPRFEFGGIDGTLFEEQILGEVLRQTVKAADEIHRAVDAGKTETDVTIQEPGRLYRRAINKALKDLQPDLAQHYRDIQRVVKAFEA